MYVRLVVELGAGSALPSLLAATLPGERHASVVVATEYPDPLIMETLRGNVERARQQRGKPHPSIDDQGTEECAGEEQGYCKIECAEFEWGSDVSQLLLSLCSLTQLASDTWRSDPPQPCSQLLPSDAGSGFDVVIMSDLLHFDSSHAALVGSLSALLAKHAGSRAYVAAGKYTNQDVCDRFIDRAQRAGIVLVEQRHEQAGWQGKMAVRGPGLDREGLRRRKEMSRFWVGRWIEWPSTPND